MSKISGKVKWFNLYKEIGVIYTEDGEEYYFHRSDFKDIEDDKNLIQNAELLFSVDKSNSKNSLLRAKNIGLHD